MITSRVTGLVRSPSCPLRVDHAMQSQLSPQLTADVFVVLIKRAPRVRSGQMLTDACSSRV